VALQHFVRDNATLNINIYNNNNGTLTRLFKPVTKQATDQNNCHISTDSNKQRQLPDDD